MEDAVVMYFSFYNFVFIPERNASNSLNPEGLTEDGEDILYQKDASFSAELAFTNFTNEFSNDISPSSPSAPTTSSGVTSQSPNLEQKVPIAGDGVQVTHTTQSLSTKYPQEAATTSACTRDCGPGGACALDDGAPGMQYCDCPLGRGGDYCEKGRSFHFGHKCLLH